LIEVLSAEGDLILDPFCGSGTTGVEATLLNRQAILSDVNRSSLTVSKAKSAMLSDGAVQNELEIFARTIAWDAVIDFENTPNHSKAHREALANWYHPSTLSELDYLWSLIEKYNGSKTYWVLQMIFSNVLFACASTKGAETKTGRKRQHHWGWVADNVLPKPPVLHAPIKAFRDKIFETINSIRSIEKRAFQPFSILRQDARKLGIKNNSIDLIVTSPPYIGMIDYTRANRLHYAWMEWDLNEREGEIGARYKRQRKNIVEQYLSDMQSCALELSRVLKPGGYCAIIIGASRSFAGTDTEVLKIIERYLVRTWGPKERVPTRRRVSNKEGTSSSEYICVFRKE